MSEYFAVPKSFYEVIPDLIRDQFPLYEEYKDLLNKVCSDGFLWTSGMFVTNPTYSTVSDSIAYRVVSLLCRKGDFYYGFVNSFKMFDFGAKQFKEATEVDYFIFSQIDKMIDFRDYQSAKFFVRVLADRHMNRKPTLVTISRSAEWFVDEGARLKMFDARIVEEYFQNCLKVEVSR